MQNPYFKSSVASQGSVDSDWIQSSEASEAVQSMAVSVEDYASERDSDKKQMPKIREVNEFIIYYDEIICQDGLGTVVKA